MRKRIALVYTGLNDLGGANHHLALIYKHLIQKRFEVYIICCSSAEAWLREFFVSVGVQAEHIQFVQRWKKWFFFPMIFSLAHYFRLLKPDVVHSFGIQSDIFCGLAAKPVYVKKMYAYYESQPLTEISGRIKNIFYRTINALVKNKFWRTVAVSEGVKYDLVRMKLRQADKISVIYLGIEPDSGIVNFDKRIERLSLQRPVIGTIGRFSSEKGLDRFLKAAAIVRSEVPMAHFVLIGGGPQKKELVALAHQLDLGEAVEFREWTSNPRAEMQQFDLFVMPSFREGCPRALLEALSVGCPVVASDIPGINEIVRHKREGILVDTASTEHFARAVIEACLNPQRTIEFAKNGYFRVRNQFTIQKEMASLISFYD